MAKRIQMRKNRFLALQKMAEQKKNEAMTNAANAVVDVLGDMLPKQTIVNMTGGGGAADPKGGTLRPQNTTPVGKNSMMLMAASPPGGGPLPPGPHHSASHHMLHMQQQQAGFIFEQFLPGLFGH